MSKDGALLAMAEAERTELSALLSTLTPDQWATPSLCEGWSVKDVVAHMISYDVLGPVDLVRRLVKGRVGHANEVGVREMRALDHRELLDLFCRHLRPRDCPPPSAG